MNWNKSEHKWRKQLLSYAKGNVLEAGVGMGNNFKYYPPGVSVTATDISARMIDKAKEAAGRYGIKASLIVSPVETLQLPPQSFDTIVSTFSLCAYENPKQVLQQFEYWCKPGGRILLLEYGLSRYKVVQWVQQFVAAKYYHKTGNHITRDVNALLSKTGFKTSRTEIKYGGIIYLIWACLEKGPQ